VATSDKSKPADAVPADLLPIIRNSGVLTERQFTDVRSKVISGEYPSDSKALAHQLVRDGLLTEYQTRRFLGGKSHGLLVGKYVILDRLGSGSMGRVYKAHHQLMGRIVALKIIAPEIVTNERVVARFQREMRLVGRLDHPNVVRAYDADQSNGILYIVMEYVTGQSLGQRLKEGPLVPVDAVTYASQAALGLAHAHEQGIVHRDVKPSNLLLNDDRVVKVLDLGLGVLMDGDSHATFATADGVAVGTVDYMSPEQACGREVDGRSDLFSLGCSLYHLITGRQAFPGDSPIERLGRRINNRPVPITDLRPDLPSSLVVVLDKLLATKPQDRYQTAGEAADALSALVKPKKSPATGTAAPAAPPVAKKPPTEPSAEPRQPEVPSPPPPPVIVTVRPKYPAWFLPLANLAEKNPTAALLVLTTGFLIGGLIGAAIGWFAKG
jgi:eukaryotic-like serine/threonine-protein kinase